MTQEESGYIAHTCDDMRTAGECLSVGSRAPGACAALPYRARVVRTWSIFKGAHCWCTYAVNSDLTRSNLT